MTRFVIAARGFAAAVVFSWVGSTQAAVVQQGVQQGPYSAAPPQYQAPRYQAPRYQAVPQQAAPFQATPQQAAVRPQAARYTATPPAFQPRQAVQPQPAPARYIAQQGFVPQPNYRVAARYEAVPSARYAMQPPATAPVTPIPPQPALVAPVNTKAVTEVAVGGTATEEAAPVLVPSPSDATADWGSFIQNPTGDACNDCDYGTFGGGSGWGNDQLLGREPSDREWFFGIYGLYMGRDKPGYARLGIQVDDGVTYPYYPSQSNTVLSTSNIDPDFQWGAEIRFGSTFGSTNRSDACNTACDTGCDTGCNTGCNTGCGPRPYAWEVVYWGLSDDSQQSVITDSLADTDRLYSSVNFTGLMYDRDGAGGAYADRRVNDYYDYDMPINDPAVDTNSIRVLGMRVRSNFKAQNLELNFIRFPLANCGSADGCGPRFMFNGVCGVRYFKMDEDFQLGVMYSDTSVGTDPNSYTSFPTNDDNVLFYDIATDNELVGLQLGSNMNWLIASKWTAFCDTQFGIYGNSISNSHRVWSGGGGTVTYGNGGGAANTRSTKTDVSFLGEARLGVGYQVSCNCRWTTAYRVMAVTGVALSVEQIPTDWANSNYVGTIDSNDSLVLHGLQTGFEWKY